MEGDQEVVLVVVRDLLMSSRVTTVAKGSGAPVRVLRDAAKLAVAEGRLAIGDLDQEGVIEALAAWSQGGARPVAGFVQHVNTEVIRRARGAGLERIIPRSRLEAALSELLAGL